MFFVKDFKNTNQCIFILPIHYFYIFLLAKRNPSYIICTLYKLTTNSSHVLKQNKTPNKLLNQEQIIGFEFSY